MYTRPDESPKVEFFYKFVDGRNDDEYDEFLRGEGPSMGHCFRSILDQLADNLGIDKEEL